MPAPYLQRRATGSEFVLAHGMLKTIRPQLRRQCEMHYLHMARPDKRIAYIEAQRRYAPVFLRFDIRRFFPDIPHAMIEGEVEAAHYALRGRALSRPLQRQWDSVMPDFLGRVPGERGLPIGHPLSHVLAGMVLLRFDLGLQQPFLRVTDDYLVLCRTQRDAQRLYEDTVIPALQLRGLAPNTAKVATGSFGRDGVTFIGYRFKGGHIGIDAEKRAAFSMRIRGLTSLKRRKEVAAIIKALNRQINGFGHYYKHAATRNVFDELDAEIRQRLRRYISRRKRHADVAVLNTALGKEDLEALGLKSLVDIKDRHDKGKKQDEPARVEKSERAMVNDAQPAHTDNLLTARLDALSAKIEKQNKILRRIDKRLARLEKKGQGQ